MERSHKKKLANQFCDFGQIWSHATSRLWYIL